MKKSILLIATVGMLYTQVPRLQAQDQSDEQVGESETRVDETTLSIDTGESPGVENEVVGSGFGAWDYLRMVLVLGAVVGAIVGIFYLLKRAGGVRFQDNRMIRLVGSRTLANNRTVHLVEVGNQVFLVGASENNVSLIAEISDKETLDGIKLQAAGSEELEERRTFSETIQQIFGRAAGANGAARDLGRGEARQLNDGTVDTDVAGFLQRQRQRLKSL